MTRYPEEVALQSDLLIASNNASTTLSASLDADEELINVLTTALFASSGVISIGNEIIKYVSKTATQFICTSGRGYDGTIATAHSSGDSVRGNIIAKHHNILSDEICAIESELGTQPKGSSETVAARLTSMDLSIALKASEEALSDHTELTTLAHGGIVADTDSRLSDSREPLSHSHAEGDVTALVADLAARELTANKGVANGYAPLNPSILVPNANLPWDNMLTQVLPENIGGTIFADWWAEYGVTKDGSNKVSNWADRISGRAWVQATGANQPTWIDSRINGHPTIVFDKALSQWMHCETLGSCGAGFPYAMLVVMKVAYDGSSMGILVGNTDGTYDKYHRLLYITGGRIGQQISTAASSVKVVMVDPLVYNQTLVVSGYTDLNANRFNLREAGTPLVVNSNIYQPSWFNRNFFALGCDIYAGYNPYAYFSGEVARIILFTIPPALPMLETLENAQIKYYAMDRYHCIPRPTTPHGYAQTLSGAGAQLSDVDFLIEADAQYSSQIYELPSLGYLMAEPSAAGFIYYIYKKDATANTVTVKVKTASGDLFDNGASTIVFTKQNEGAFIIGGASWATGVWKLAATPPETAFSLGTLFNTLTTKTTPADADQLGLMDSAASNELKKFSWANVKATLNSSYGSLANSVEKLTAHRNYFVRSDGNDSNDGSANDAAHAFLTLQHAVDVCAALNFNNKHVIIDVADGTYAAVTVPPMFGVGSSGYFQIRGNTTTPANCIIAGTTGSAAFQVCGPTGYYTYIYGFKVSHTTGGGVYADPFVRYLELRYFEFGACAGAHMYANQGSFISVGGSPGYTISGNAAYHIYGQQSGKIIQTGTVTLTGTPAFTIFAHGDYSGLLYAVGVTFVGSGTGIRYLSQRNAIIETGGGGANYFPGSVAGSSPTQGQYL